MISFFLFALGLVGASLPPGKNENSEACRQLQASFFSIRIDPAREGELIATTVLYRPAGPRELDLIRDSGWTRFPPRLPEQPIFYPVENEGYARQITGNWNVKSSGEGHVLRFAVDSAFLSRYPVQQVGNATHREYWVPAEDLEAFNDHIVGPIEVIASYAAENGPP